MEALRGIRYTTFGTTMGRWRNLMRARRLATGAAVVVLAVLVPFSVSRAQDQVTVPTSVGQTVTVSWQGTTLPGANTTSDCSGATAIGADVHEVDLLVPAGTYDNVAVLATASIAFSGTNDLIVTIVRPDGSSVSGDNGFVGEGESVSISNPPAGLYRIITCPFAGTTTQNYSGTLVLAAS